MYRSSSQKTKQEQLVVVRIRPMNTRENLGNTLPVITASTSDRSVTVIKGTGSRQVRSSYQFDNVFGSFSTQEEVYEATIRPVIVDVMNGYESTIFAYGQTGTGKTHTMEGDINDKNGDNQGVIPRSAVAIFEELKKDKYSERDVTCSYLEIYNEELCDLCVDNEKTKKKDLAGLKIMEDAVTGTFCKGLSEHKVSSATDVLSVMTKAATQRRIGETKMNKQSSRSHCLFTLTVKAKVQYPDGVMAVSGKLHMVDLAGSECAKSANLEATTSANSKTVPGVSNDKGGAARERERMNINQSLLTLGRVISSLKEKTLKPNATIRVPYRDSKLTRVLQESLGGRCKTVIIATLSPSDTAIEESISTLNYAQSANGIVNKPVATSYLNVGAGNPAFSGKSDGDEGGGQSLQHWHEMECRLQYMQGQVEEAQGALARKHLQFQEINNKMLEVEKKNVKMVEEVKVSKDLVKRTQFKLKSTANTEQVLGEQAKTLLSTLKTTISDSDQLHGLLHQAVAQEKTTRASAKEFKDTSKSLADTIASSLSTLTDTITSSSSEITASSSFSATLSLASLASLSTLVNQLSALRQSHHDSTSSTTGTIATSCEELQQKTTATLTDTVMSTFTRAEESLTANVADTIDTMNSHKAALESTLVPAIDDAHNSSTAKAAALFDKLSNNLAAVETDLSSLSATTESAASATHASLDEVNALFSATSISNFTDFSNLTESFVLSTKTALESFTAKNNHQALREFSASHLVEIAAHEEKNASLQAQNEQLVLQQQEMIKEAQAEQEAAHKRFTDNMYKQMQAVVNAESEKLKETISARFEQQKEQSEKLQSALKAESDVAETFVSSQRAGGEKVVEFADAGLKLDVEVVSSHKKTIANFEQLTEQQKEFQLTFTAAVGENAAAIGAARKAAEVAVEGVRAVGENVGDLAKEAGGDVAEQVGAALDEVKANGDAVVKAALENVDAMKGGLEKVQSPRAEVQEQVEAAGKQVLTELRANIGHIEKATKEICEDSSAMMGEFVAKVETFESERGAEGERVQASQEGLAKELEELGAKGGELIAGAKGELEGLVAATDTYAVDVVKVEEAVEEVPALKKYPIDTFLYQTSAEVEAEYNEAEEEKNEEGAAPVKVPIDVELRSWVEPEEVKENGLGKARRRRSSVGGGMARESLGEITRDVLRESLLGANQEAGGEVVLSKSVASPKRGRKSVAPVKGKAGTKSPRASVSPRPSTAGARGKGAKAAGAEGSRASKAGGVRVSREAE